MAKPLTRAERIDLGTRALRMSARGLTNVQISEQLGVSSKTVGRLVREAADEIFDLEDRERLREEVIASINEVKLRVWAELDRRKDPTPAQKARDVPGDRVVGPTARTLPRFLEVIGQQDDRLVKLLGLRAPEEVSVIHRTPAERIQAFEEWRRSKGRPPLHVVRYEGPRAPAQDGSRSSEGEPRLPEENPNTGDGDGRGSR